jgi:sulfur carrier protein
MQILLEFYVPTTIWLFMITLFINGKRRDFEQNNITVANLVHILGLEGKRLAIELNGMIVARGSFEQTVLRPDDKLEIVGAVGGG